MNRDRRLLDFRILAAEEAIATLVAWCRQYGVDTVAMGDRTTANSWRDRLSANLPETIPVVLVDEHNSTVEARDRYWQMFPPRGLTRLLPPGLRVPPRPVDDIVAILLIERYLDG